MPLTFTSSSTEHVDTPARRPPGSPPPEPSRRSAAARGTAGSSSRSAAWGSSRRSTPRGSPTAARGDHCGCSAAPACAPLTGGAEVLDVELHHPFDDARDHLAQQIGVRPFSRGSASAMLGLVIVAFSGAGPGVVTQTYTRTDDGRLPGGPTGLDPGHDHRTTLQRSG